jgi:hypothetical protein
MGIVEDVYIPEIDSEASDALEDYGYDAPIFGEIAASESRFKSLYQNVMDGIYAAAAYKNAYERSVESLGYAIKQMNNAKSNIDQITDQNKDEIITAFISDSDTLERLKQISNAKAAEFQTIIDKLNEYKKRIIERNNELATVKSFAQGIAYHTNNRQ